MKRIIKIGLVIPFILLLFSIFSRVDAATADISASKTTVNVGEKVTIKVSINAAAWDIHISDAVSADYSDVTEDTKNKSLTKTLSFTPSKEGTYTVNLSGNVTDENSTNGKPMPVSKSVTITANKKSDISGITSNESKQEPIKEPTFKSVNETVYSTGSINVRESAGTDSKSLGQLKSGESVTRIGTGDNGWSKVSYNGKTGYIRSDLITTQEPAKSTDKTLKALEIKPDGLDPEFNPDTTSYTLNIGMDIEALEINATPNDEKSKIEITGNEALQVGDNMIKITVTAEDGTTRIYNIDVKKGEISSLGLTSIKINGYQLSPAFSTDVYEYKINVMDSNVNNLDLVALANDEKATVEVSGNTSLKDGENTIVITVTSEDGTEKVVYQIYVNKILMPVSKKDKSPIKYFVVGIGVIIFIAIIIIIKRRKNRMFEESDNYEDLYGYSRGVQGISNKNNEKESIDEQVDKKVIGNFYSLENEDFNNFNPNKQPLDETKIINTQDNKNDILYQHAEEIPIINPYANQNLFENYNNDLEDNINQENVYKNVYNANETMDQAKSLIENTKEVIEDYNMNDDEYKARKRGKHSK